MRCASDNCNKRPIPIAGNCKYCTLCFCGKHRLPEFHDCAKFENCKKENFEKNKKKLISEKCVPSKIK